MASNCSWPAVLPRQIHRELPRLAPINPWFEIYRVSGGVWSIVEPYHDEEVISYLIAGQERAALVDTGLGVADIRAEAENLTGLPLIVINSHGHWDHLGGNHQFAEVLAYDDVLEVAQIERGLTVTQCAAAGYMRPERLCRQLPDGFNPTCHEIRPCIVTRRLHDLEQVDLGGRTLIIHHTPGHSPGSICIEDTRDRILFTGDTYYPGSLYARFTSSDFGAYCSSIERIAALIPQLRSVSPSHNESQVPTGELLEALAGFRRIKDGTAPYTVTGDGLRKYDFGRFRVELPAQGLIRE